MKQRIYRICILLMLFVVLLPFSAAAEDDPLQALRDNTPLWQAIMADLQLIDQDPSLQNPTQIGIQLNARGGALNLSSQQLEHLKGLGQLPSDHQLSSLSGLGILSGYGLTRINLSQQPQLFAGAAADITLPQLRLCPLVSLTAESCAISNLSFLSQGFGALQKLSLADNTITDASPLAGLMTLTDLDLSENPLSRFTFLPGLNRLSSLCLNQTGFSDGDFASLLSLPLLSTLELAQNRITSTLPLQQARSEGKLAQMKMFAIHENYIRWTDFGGDSSIPDGFNPSVDWQRQYHVAAEYNGSMSVPSTVAADMQIRLMRRLQRGDEALNSWAELPIAGYSLEGAAAKATSTHGALLVQPVMAGSAKLTLNAFAAPYYGNHCTITTNLSIPPGPKSATILYDMSGQRLPWPVTGLYDHPVNFTLPSPEAWSHWINDQGFMADEWMLPAGGTLSIAAGQSPVIGVSRIDGGRIQILHLTGSGQILNYEECLNASSGTYTFSPRKELHGLKPANGAPVVFRFRAGQMQARVLFYYLPQ